MSMLDRSMFDSEVERDLTRFPPPQVDAGMGMAAIRAAYDTYFADVRSRSAPPPAGVSTEELSVPSLVDDHAIPVRVYRPADPVNGRGFLYIHGGAFVMGDLELEDARCRTMALEAGCVVVAVDYRLAPEHRFPLPLDDCHSALRWVADHAGELSIDPRRLGVGGCSAGGALAAGLAIRCRDGNGPPLAFQMLVYPVLDASLSSGSLSELTTEDEFREMEQMWDYFLDGPRSAASEYASPASCGKLAGLPAAYIVAAEFDPLRDEAIAYAQRLLGAGVNVELHVWSKVPHAVDLFVPDAKISQDSVKEQADALARFLD
jgi:acetyl esterase/lipase